MTAGCGHMGTGVVSGPHAQKDVVSGPNAQNWLQAAQDLFDGLQNTWAHHMVSKVHGLTTMVSKMQKLCIWAEMYQNDGLRWISPRQYCGAEHPSPFAVRPNRYGGQLEPTSSVSGAPFCLGPSEEDVQPEARRRLVGGEDADEQGMEALSIKT